MASMFGHAAVAYTMSKTCALPIPTRRLLLLTTFCTIAPDADVVGYFLGIPYGHMLGHRGLSHSIAFAFVFGVLVARFACPGLAWRSAVFRRVALYFSIATISHGILDAFTDGGLGIAFLAPFDATRYFFPWRPIAVSPIGVSEFFSGPALTVLRSEVFWIAIPAGLWLLLLGAWRRFGFARARGIGAPLR